MREPGGGARLPQEALAHLGGAREEWREHLDRDFAIELDVVREVDDAHATTSELALDVVLAGKRLGQRRDFGGKGRHAGRLGELRTPNMLRPHLVREKTFPAAI